MRKLSTTYGFNHECTGVTREAIAEARHGEIEISTATRLAYILTSLANMIRDSEMEDRVMSLEERIKRQ